LDHLVFLVEELCKCVSLGSLNQLFHVFFKLVHLVTEMILFLEHLLSIFVKGVVKDLKEVFDVFLVSHKTINHVSPFCQIQVLQGRKLLLDIVSNMCNAYVVMTLMILTTHSAVELV